MAIAAALVVAAACVAWWPRIRNEAFVIAGSRNMAGAWYGFWSGFAGGVRVFEWAAIGGLLYWHNTCHYSPWCIRPGKYPAAGGLFKLCHVHHPELGVRPHHHLIHRLHLEHKQRRR